MFASTIQQKSKLTLVFLLLSFCCTFLLTPLYVEAQNNTNAQNSADLTGGKTLNKDLGTGGKGLTAIVADQGIVIKTLYNLFTGIGALAIWIGGFLLDYSISLLVVDMGWFIKTANLGPGISMLWMVIRDLFNLAFIFSLIYLGFKTILRINESQTKRTLVTILAAALLINFSLFFTKFIIDFSNLAAYEIYKAIEIKGTTSIFFGNIEVSGVAGEFIQLTDLNNYDASAASNISKIGKGAFGGYIYVLFGLLIMCCLLAAAFVFASGAILLIARFITLIILMIFSPILFLGWVLPSFKGYSDKWMSKFLNSAFVAPAYLFMLYLALTILSQVESLTNSPTGINGAMDFESTGLFGFFIFYALVIGFLWAALLVAQKMSAAATNRAIAITSGATARLGRATVGRGGQWIADNENVKERASRSGAVGFINRRLQDVGGVAGSASFDARNVGVVNKQLGISEGKKGGFKKTRDDYVKKQQARAKSFGEVGDEDDEVKELQKAVDEAQFEFDNAPKEKKNSAKFKLNEAKEALSTEKQRRVLGSASLLGPNDNHLKVTLDSIQKNIQTYYDRFDATKDETQKAAYAKIIFDFKHDLKKTKEKIKKAGGGYANVLENTGHLTAWIQGHPKPFDDKAGKDIRKTFSKKVKETKEDKQFGSIRNALKQSNKKTP